MLLLNVEFRDCYLQHDADVGNLRIALTAQVLSVVAGLQCISKCIPSGLFFLILLAHEWHEIRKKQDPIKK